MRLKGFLLRVMRRVAAVTLTLAAAVGLTVAGALPALADTHQDYVAVSGVGDITSSSTCDVLLLSAQVSAGGPAYVSAFIENGGSKTCTGWIERSVNKGKTWTTVSKRVAVPRYKPAGYAKTADYYTGGDLARPCYQYGTGKATCGPAVTLKGSKARDTGGSLPVSYAREAASASSSGAQCEAGLGSTTTAKKPSSSVDAFVINISSSFTKAGPACTAVLQESANGGKSWKTVSASHVVPAPADAIGLGFTAAYADGTGHAARVCVALASSPKAQHCSKAW
jgi:hypothetical protein